jgi:hypothetical protein
MSELAINISAENLVLVGFLSGLVLAWLGAGVRVLLGSYDRRNDPEL